MTPALWLLLVGASPAQITALRFTLPATATTSAALFDSEDRLVRTLWSGERIAAGTYRRDIEAALAGRVATGELTARLLHHDVRYIWEGVVGNSSAAFTGPTVHRSYHVPTGLAAAAGNVYYAVGYNEFQRGIHTFDPQDPQHDLRVPDNVNPFSGFTMIAADGRRLYAASTGGLSRSSFVTAFELPTHSQATLAAGQPLCMNRRPGSGVCYEGQDYRSVIDLVDDAADVPTGLAVQADGRWLAVARGQRQQIELFDKTSGRSVGKSAATLDPRGANQLAFAANGDLWVLTPRGAQRMRVDASGTIASAPTATIDGLAAPLAIAAAPAGDGVWIADGGASQQIKRYDAGGRLVATIGRAGGYADGDPTVSTERLCFQNTGRSERTGLAAAPDGSVWVVDTCNNRMLQFARDGAFLQQIAWLPAVYAAAADGNNGRRVFANFLEFEVDPRQPLAPGLAGWKLVRNWLPGLPRELRDDETANRAFSGFRAVTTLANGRTYGLLPSGRMQAVVELPARGPLKLLRSLAMPGPGATPKFLHDDGDLGWTLVGPSLQLVLRQRLLGFGEDGNPRWSAEPNRIASVPVRPDTPNHRGGWSGLTGPRFPMTAGGKVVFFDPSVVGNEGDHLGAVRIGGSDWLWTASPSAPLDGRGNFQTLRADRLLRAADRGIQYGGNVVVAAGEHIVYGFHGEFYTDQSNGKVGQANQFMHFHESGLFIGQFGVPSTRATGEAQAGVSGNAFSPSLVRTGDRLYLYHNDESTHAGVHRWRIDGWDGVKVLSGAGRVGSEIVLR